MPTLPAPTGTRPRRIDLDNADGNVGTRLTGGGGLGGGEFRRHPEYCSNIDAGSMKPFPYCPHCYDKQVQRDRDGWYCICGWSKEE
uniref:Uncharacterized protein n=1 Tax=viral metagenome TaxID=1070528 RepID=A0A6M3JM28_9ZZZZ